MLLSRRTKAFVDTFGGGGCWRQARCFFFLPSAVATASTTPSRRSMITTWTKVPLSFHNNNNNNKTTVLTVPEQYSAAPSSSNSSTVMMDQSGRRLWPTAIPLLEYVHQDIQKTRSMTNNHHDTSSIRIIELGAGCGLVGMGLAATVPSTILHHVHLTDQDTRWIHKTFTENQNQIQSCPISIQTLKWGEEDKEDINISNEVQQPSTNTNNTSTTTYLIGSDVLYNPATHSDLWKTVSQLSKAAMGGNLHPKPNDSSSSSGTIEAEEESILSSSSNNVVQIILVDPIRTQNDSGADDDDDDEKFSRNSTTTDLFYQSILDNTSDDNFWKEQVVRTSRVTNHSFMESTTTTKKDNDNHHKDTKKKKKKKKMYSILHMTIASRGMPTTS